MQDSIKKLTIQLTGLLFVCAVGFIVMGFPLLIVMGLSLLGWATKNEASTRMKIFARTSVATILATGVLAVGFLMLFLDGVKFLHSGFYPIYTGLERFFHLSIPFEWELGIKIAKFLDTIPLEASSH